MVGLIAERIASPEINQRHRDALIRLRALLEDDLAAEQDDRSNDRRGREVA